MKAKITLKQLYLQSYSDTSGISNYPLFKLLCEEIPFIFYDLMLTLEDSIYEYPLLKAYLSAYTAYDLYDGALPHSKVNRSTLLDLILLQMFGQRKCNNVIDDFRYNYTPFNDEEVNYANFATELSFMIINRFADRWEEYISSLTIEYNPIHNYDMKENEKVNSKITTHDDNTDSSVGFNIADVEDASPVATQSAIITTEGEDKDNKRELTRSGNIGVTTSQQMLESEIKLRDENVIVKRLIEDVVGYITLSIY